MFSPDEKNLIIVALIIIVGVTLGKMLRGKFAAESKPIDPNAPLSTMAKLKLITFMFKDADTIVQHLKLIGGNYQFHNLPTKPLTDVIVSLARIDGVLLNPPTVDRNFNKITNNILAMLQGQYWLINDIPELATVDNQVIYEVVKMLHKGNSKLVPKDIVERIENDLTVTKNAF